MCTKISERWKEKQQIYHIKYEGKWVSVLIRLLLLTQNGHLLQSPVYNSWARACVCAHLLLLLAAVFVMCPWLEFSLPFCINTICPTCTYINETFMSFQETSCGILSQNVFALVNFIPGKKCQLIFYLFGFCLSIGCSFHGGLSLCLILTFNSLWIGATFTFLAQLL